MPPEQHDEAGGGSVASAICDLHHAQLVLQPEGRREFVASDALSECQRPANLAGQPENA